MEEVLGVVGQQACGLNLTTCICYFPDVSVDVYTIVHIYMHYMDMTRPESANNVAYN
jgi:hypothetical protein